MNYSYLPKPDLAERLPPGNSFTVVGDGGSSRFDVSYVVRTKRAAVVALSPVAAFALWLGVLAVDPYYPFFGFQIPTPLVAVLIALSSLYQALMMLFGREVIDINPAVLTHRRGPFGVGFPTRYQMDLI